MAAWRLWQRLSLTGGMTHIFRTTPTELLQEELAAIGARIRQFAEAAIFGRKLEEKEWRLAEMPFALGGWSFVPLDVIAPCSYLASLLANKEAIVEMRSPEVLARLEAKISTTVALIQQTTPSAKLPELKATTKQADLVHAVMAARLAQLESEQCEKMRAWMRGLRQKHASAWKTAEATLDTWMEPRLFQTAVLLSVGAEVCEKDQYCSLCRKVELDAHCHHALLCSHEAMPTKRHNEITRLFVKTAREGALSVSYEVTYQHSAERTYRADFVLAHGVPGKTKGTTGFDVTLTNTTAGYVVGRAARKDLGAALAGEDRKIRECKEELAKLGIDFCPIAFEVTGGHSPVVEEVVHYLVDQQSIMTGIPFSELVTRFWQLASIKIWSANAYAVTRCRTEILYRDDLSEEDDLGA
jgi:hypothetical protein